MIKFLRLIFILAIIHVLTGCKNEPGFNPPSNEVSRTLFIYIAGQNSLGAAGYDFQNLDALQLGATRANLNGGKVIIYHDGYSGPPQLLEISAGSDGKGRRLVLEEYPEQNSADPSVFLSAVNDMRTHAPADSYGLVIWSHATGWMPSEMHNTYARFSSYGRSSADGGLGSVDPEVQKYIRDPFEPETRAVLQDGSNWMEMTTLVDAIPAGLFDFVVFDCCLMGAAEIAYELRNKTNYVVASPAEVIAYGLPYDRIVAPVFAETPRLGANGIAEAFFDHYNTKSGQMQSATTAVYDCRKMEALGNVMARIIGQNADKLGSLDVGLFQTYDRYSRRTMFDIVDVVESLVPEGDPLRTEFHSALDAVVTYKATTGLMVNLPIDVDRYSGMSIYVPLDQYDDLNQYYKQTAWYRNVYSYDEPDVSRTIFVYMAADNSLGKDKYDLLNITNSVSGASGNNIGSGQIVIYHDGYNTTPELILVSADAAGQGRKQVIKTYDEQNSADLSVFTSAINDMQQYAPADSYGLIMWSHGTGWMPASMHASYTSASSSSLTGYDPSIQKYIRDPFRPLTRAFGQDGSDWMEIDRIAEALPSDLFDFVIFDACYMGGIETAYALREKTRFIVASPAEVLGEGMPYHLITQGLFRSDPREAAIAVSEIYYDYYNSKSGSLQSATTAVYECSAIEGLASVMSSIISDYSDRIAQTDVSGLQHYDRGSAKTTMFDLREFIYRIAEDNFDGSEFETALDAVIPYKATTGRMLELPIDENRYSGISTYIPLTAYSALNEHYRNTAWYQRVFN